MLPSHSTTQANIMTPQLRIRVNDNLYLGSIQSVPQMQCQPCNRIPDFLWAVSQVVLISLNYQRNSDLEKKMSNVPNVGLLSNGEREKQARSDI